MRWGEAEESDDAGDHDARAVARAAEGLVGDIVASGALEGEPAWRAAFEEVHRHVFVPYFYVLGDSGWERLWGQDPDAGRRARWLRDVYTDTPLATRVRDGELVSSSSQPSLMARMLVELRVTDGDTVLEIGAGTGYNAALLAHRLGEGQVTTVDLEPEITEAARRHLAAAGYRPHVVTGDGSRGCAGRAPFDRILATCTLDTVPPAWLAQCRPGALILAPLATGLILLRVQDARHAEGRFLHTPAYFVPLRGTGTESGGGARACIEGDGYDSGTAARRRTAGLPRSALRSDRFRFLLALTAGGLDPQEALALWEREGDPARERYGVTVSGDRVWAWLDSPQGPYAWPLP